MGRALVLIAIRAHSGSKALLLERALLRILLLGLFGELVLDAEQL